VPFLFYEQTPFFRPGYFVSILDASGIVLDGSLSGGVLFLVHFCTLLAKPLFICLFSRVADGVFRYSLDYLFQFFTFFIQAYWLSLHTLEFRLKLFVVP
jgi:hypothetical protein